MKPLPINEYFYTWQGEGTHLGRAAFFIRTQGCPVHCPWCDSAGTWHPDYVPRNVQRLTPDQLVKAAKETQCEFVVVTGGEPTIHDLSELTHAMHRADLPVHLETCGAYPIKGDFDWITLSPKWQKQPTPENLRLAHEIKIIVEEPDSIEKWMAAIENHLQGQSIWLHIEWSQRENSALLEAINRHVKTHGNPFRTGIQAHKYFAVDAMDPRTQKPAPLGGNAQKA